jgi:hypothetical protein
MAGNMHYVIDSWSRPSFITQATMNIPCTSKETIPLKRRTVQQSGFTIGVYKGEVNSGI